MQLAGKMKPLPPEAEDAQALQELGYASVQVVHDLKNQLHGLKLYATFLRKRSERSERPADERETITKLIAGLERMTGDLAALVRYGRPLELQFQPRADLARILTTALAERKQPLDISLGSYEGRFDSIVLGEALKDITMAVCAPGTLETELLKIYLRRDEGDNKSAMAIIEWHGAEEGAEDSLRSVVGVGASGVRMKLAAKVIEAHGGQIEYRADGLRVRLPLLPSR